MTEIIYTDRSRIETFEHCPRKRYWQYEYQGIGLEKVDDLKIDARIGAWVHNGIENGLISTDSLPSRAAAEASGLSFERECKTIVDWPQTPDQLKRDITEGGQIVTALVYAWLRLKAPRLLDKGEVLGVEKELMVDFSTPT